MALLSVLRIRLPRYFALFTLTLAALFAAFTPTAHALTATSTTLTTSSATVPANQLITLTAKVSPIAVGHATAGRVNFLDGTQVIGSVTLAVSTPTSATATSTTGSATLRAAFTAVGTHLLSAVFVPEAPGLYAAEALKASTSKTLTQTISAGLTPGPLASTTTLNVSAIGSPGAPVSSTPIGQTVVNLRPPPFLRPHPEFATLVGFNDEDIHDKFESKIPAHHAALGALASVAGKRGYVGRVRAAQRTKRFSAACLAVVGGALACAA
jgi:hypothetical protein